KNILLMKLEGVNSLDQAEDLRGAEVLINREAFSRDDGEYFWYELVGLKVFLDTGEYLGTVSRIIPAGSNDIYVVGNGEREVFIPAIYEVVKEIDLDTEKMTISPVEGLLDLNEV
ncbi:MAG: 16S rRNA processing protein RimM, partial [Desulfobacteraceae bacterium]|nr:16S rRNA processing protein RimM [Desulfobacteraceae bacterium]